MREYEPFLGRTSNGRFFVESNPHKVAERIAKDDGTEFFKIEGEQGVPKLSSMRPKIEAPGDDDYEIVGVRAGGKNLGNVRRLKPEVRAQREAEAAKEAEDIEKQLQAQRDEKKARIERRRREHVENQKGRNPGNEPIPESKPVVKKKKKKA